MQGVLVTPQSLYCACRAGGAGRRRHQRRRDWPSDAQQQRGGGDGGGVTLDLESVIKGARQALRRVEAHCARIAEPRELVVSFRPLGALGFCALSLLFLAAAVKALVSKYQRARQRSVVRRDRSLGGREVVVALQHAGAKSSSRAASRAVPAANLRRGRKEGPQLPQWWRKQEVEGWRRPQDVHARQQAEALVRGMMEKRLQGLDFAEEDICQLRALCSHTGVKVRFATENARDAFFRAATNALLSACMCSPSRSNHFGYCGEDAASFLSGLAANIQLEEERAASIVNAAVASRTRAGFLQAWASVLRGNELEADDEIRGLVSMHCVFPAHEDSPEMEMVGHGLGSHLTPEERNELFKMYKRYGDSTLSIAMEALALNR